MICCALLVLALAPMLCLARHLVLRPATAANPLVWRLHVESAERLQPFSLRSRLRSFAFAGAGIRHMLQHEHNAWVHLAATCAVLGAALVLRISAADWRWIAVAVLWVWSAEALNTAIEHVCNLVSPGQSDHVHIAKDVAAGAVLLSAIGAAVIGALTFWPHLMPEAVAICRR
jgi:diacylglycerol kinase (ATP)